MKLFNKAKNETVNTEEKRNTDATQFVNAVNDAINKYEDNRELDWDE